MKQKYENLSLKVVMVKSVCALFYASPFMYSSILALNCYHIATLNVYRMDFLWYISFLHQRTLLDFNKPTINALLWHMDFVLVYNVGGVGVKIKLAYFL